MSTDFYSALAEELCSIKNSPFSLLKSTSHPIQDSNPSIGSIHIIKSAKISHDPERFFSPDKKKRLVVDDPSYREIER
jgi:hypothetical protein